MATQDGGSDIDDAIVSEVQSAVGPVPRVATRLTRRDHLGAARVRWGIGRSRYRVPPGLYAVGSPDGDSPVLVSANYKLSFDALRRELEGLDAWILVVDTDGVNVWCSAAKGTFSTDEVVRCVQEERLAQLVRRRRLILPQLAATGVAAREVKRRTGFYVTYGPVRARDVRAFLAAGCKATDDMRRVHFRLWDRLVLVPVELAHALRGVALLALLVMAVAGLHRHGFSVADAWHGGWPSAAAIVGATLAGLLVTPALLPWLPGRPFSVKGAVAGLAWVGVWLAARHALGLPGGAAAAAAHVLLLVPWSAFLAMSYTGCSTFTSLSGVRLEMRFALPAMIASAVGGIAVWLVVAFSGGWA